MPDRILRDYSTSEKFDGFPGSPETLFTRLLTKVDDYGRFDGDPVNVRGACYPRAENLRANTVDAWLKELSDHHLILCYQVGCKKFLAIINNRQRLRLDAKGSLPKPKFPPPPGKPLDFRPDEGDWREMSATSGEPPRTAASGGECQPYAETNAKSMSKPVADPKNNSLSSKVSLGGVGGDRVAGDAGPMAQLLTLPNLGAAVARIMRNQDGWSYDNCRIKPNDFTPAQVTTILREFAVGKLTGFTAINAWLDAVVATHRAAVDGMPINKPLPAYCIGVWKRLMTEAAGSVADTDGQKS